MLTRVALAFVFVIFGLWEMTNPQGWTAFVIPAIANLYNPVYLVVAHGFVLFVIGVALLLGIYIRVFSALAVLVMLEVIASLFILSGFTDVLVRDVAILLLAASLFFDNTRHYALTS